MTPQNEQGEHYLTDVVSILASSGALVEALAAPHPEECMGINDRKQLADVAAVLRRRTLERLMVEGVTILDPAATYVDDTVAVGADTVIYPGAVLEGATAIGAECVVGPGCHVSGSRIGDRVTLKPYCVLSDAVVEAEAQLGPFCHLRPLSHVGAGAKIGNFVELKKSKIGRGAKVPHLSYVGDATVGDEANIGAGTITCNYDGVAKHETTIGAGAFVGTNSSLVAPVTIGEGAYVGAGSVITKNVPAGALAVARARQEVREGWAAPQEENPEGQGLTPCAGSSATSVTRTRWASSWTGSSASSTAATTRPAWPCWGPRGSRSGARPGASRCSKASCASDPCTGASASATRAGRRTGGRPTTTRIPTPTDRAPSSWSTTASSRTTCRSRSG